MNVAIVGCGLIGRKRGKALRLHTLTYAVDTDIEKAQQLAATHAGAKVSTHWQDAIQDKNTEIIVVATTNDALAEIALHAVRAGKHVLVEKPAARGVEELDAIIREARTRNVKVKVGFNHRYHPAIRKAKEMVDAGAVGSLMYMRAVYGHGGRIGYDREWRANKEIAGGGELLDQGMHLIDLAHWFFGDFSEVSGFVHTYFWNMPVEDNGFVMLKTPEKQVAWLHVSCSEWKNCFGMEIYGKKGKLHVTGLGGSYGVETLAYYRMLPAMVPPETTIYEYPFPDQSWQLELDDFMDAVATNREIRPGLAEARSALKIVEQIYQGSAV